MIVQPDFADHWKTELLIRLCGSETAVRCLLRFWSHCQNRKQWEFTNLTPEVLASICRWTGDTQVFWDAMNQTFLDRVGDVYAAHEWGDINSQLTHNWNVGKLGGRPKKTQGFPQGLPKGSDRVNPTETQGVSLGVTDRLDREEKKDKTEKPSASAVEVTCEQVVDAWNGLPKLFPKIQNLSDERRKSLRARLKNEFWLENWREALRMIPSIPFFRGEKKGSDWIINFDFFIRPNSVARIVEGEFSRDKSRTVKDEQTYEVVPNTLTLETWTKTAE